MSELTRSKIILFYLFIQEDAPAQLLPLRNQEQHRQLSVTHTNNYVDISFRLPKEKEESISLSQVT